ncbi:MAG: transcription factor E [Candidatus Hydrothermarchaeota archaeon]
MNSVLNDYFRELVLEVAGEEGIDIVSVLGGKEATDEELAQETGLRVNTVRKTLYKLYDKHLASFVRKRDKSTGWYIYVWKLDLERISEVLLAERYELLEKIEKRLDYEKNHMFFHCCSENGVCTKIPFETAAEANFVCPKCGNHLELLDNSEIINKLEREREQIYHEIEILKQFQ